MNLSVEKMQNRNHGIPVGLLSPPELVEFFQGLNEDKYLWTIGEGKNT
jgi:hypothetical protein